MSAVPSSALEHNAGSTLKTTYKMGEHGLPYRVLIDELRTRKTPDELKVIVTSAGGSGDANQCIETWLSKVEGAYKTLADLRGGKGDYDALTNATVICREAEGPLTKMLHQADLSGICLSGGGIRSATFCLGVLQGLARYSVRRFNPDKLEAGAFKGTLLGSISYLSTVSGGGYIGCWLSSWSARHPRGYQGVISELAHPTTTRLDPEPAPVRHLRDYTSYLSPTTGGLSIDLWTVIATYIRNLLVNWLMLLPMMAAATMLPIIVVVLLQHPARFDRLWIQGITVGTSCISWIYIGLKLPGFGRTQTSPPRALATTLLISSFVVAYWLLTGPVYREAFLFWVFSFMSLEIGRFALMLRAGKSLSAFLKAKVLAVHLFATLATASILAFVVVRVSYFAWHHMRLFVVWSVPFIWLAFVASTTLLSALSCKIESDQDREWWARFVGTLLLGSAAWLVITFLIVYSVEVTYVLVGTGLNIILGVFTSYIGYNSDSLSGSADPKRRNWLVRFFIKRVGLVESVGGLTILVFVVFIADMNALCFRWLTGVVPSVTMLPATLAAALVEMCGFVALTVFFNTILNVNAFSLHSMYGLRLVRTFLGASNVRRKPDGYTNFDVADNLPMSKVPKDSASPLQIINLALNVVGTTKLAWQERKAESFTVTPLHCGSFRVGYQPTESYGGDDGMSLGTAMTISGAAVSPNRGYNSSPITTLVMTLFNMRLGWWLPNPGNPRNQGASHLRSSGPGFAGLPLIREAFGKTVDTDSWVYLSDGGHFENLGLYELVLRRCRSIVVVDGSCDPKYEMEDLANALRKIHIDLGVPIEFTTKFDISGGALSHNRHCAVADIQYPAVDGPNAKVGKLIYVKASLNGNEPSDIKQYASSHLSFPHESTADQFFTESQFESYRRLGEHIIDELENSRSSNATGDFDELVKDAEEHAGKRPQEKPSDDTVRMEKLMNFLSSGHFRVTQQKEE